MCTSTCVPGSRRAGPSSSAPPSDTSTTASSRPARRRTRESGSSSSGGRRLAARRSGSEGIGPLSGAGHILEHAHAACRPKHAHRPLRSVAAADVNRAGRRGSRGGKRQNVGATELYGIPCRCSGDQSDLHTGKQLEQPRRRLDRTIDLSLDVDGQDAVAIAVLINLDADALWTVDEPQAHRGTPRDGQRARQGEATAQILRRDQPARTIDGPQYRRHRRTGDHSDQRGNEHQLDQRVARRGGRAPAPPKRRRREGGGPRAHQVPATRTASYRSAFAVATVTSGLSFRKLFSPMPRTFIRSSGFLKPPFFCRYSMIRSATALPMPGSVSSCARLAVFRFTAAAGALAARPPPARQERLRRGAWSSPSRRTESWS